LHGATGNRQPDLGRFAARRNHNRDAANTVAKLNSIQLPRRAATSDTNRIHIVPVFTCKYITT
jgi:hypothetical protein